VSGRGDALGAHNKPLNAFLARATAVYQDMTWEPKESFKAVANYYAAHEERRAFPKP